MSRDAKNGPGYAITQADLAKYRQLEIEFRRASGMVQSQRRSLMELMGGPARVEPGPLTIMVVYHDTGLTTNDEDGDEQPVLARRLVVCQASELASAS